MANSNFKIFLVSFLIFFSCPRIYSQTQTNNNQVENTNLKYGATVLLEIDKKAYFDDGLAVVLTSFSHKRPYTGGPTKATAYITLSKDQIIEEIKLSVHGTEGKTNDEKYDTLRWKEYQFQLKGIQYDKSIELVVNQTEKESN